MHHHHCLACFGVSLVESGLARGSEQATPAVIGQAIAVVDYCRPGVVSCDPLFQAIKRALYGNLSRSERSEIERSQSYRDAYNLTTQLLGQFENGTQVRMCTGEASARGQLRPTRPTGGSGPGAWSPVIAGVLLPHDDAVTC